MGSQTIPMGGRPYEQVPKSEPTPFPVSGASPRRSKSVSVGPDDYRGRGYSTTPGDYRGRLGSLPPPDF